MFVTIFILFGLLLLLLFFNVPLAVAIGLPSLIVFIKEGYGLTVFAQRVYMAADSFPLLAIPFFMLAGKIMEEGGMSRRVVRLADCIVGWIPGGLAHVMVAASAFFGALSGSSPATTAAIGSILIPEMKQKGFPADMICGLQAVAGGLGTIIPPSIPMIIYGVITGTSIGDLFIAGILPGILLSFFLMLVGFRDAKRRNVKQTVGFSLKELKNSFIDGTAALMVPVIVLGGIYKGIFTATEAGVVAVVYGFLASWIIYRELNWEKITRIFAGSVTNTILVMAVLAVSGPFSWLLAIEGVSEFVGSLILSVSKNRIVFLLVINLLFFVVGCFIETGAGILIFTPIIFPTAMSLGIDPVHLGVNIVANLSFGMATPPVGENQYIAAAIGGISFDQQVKASLPYLLIAFTGVLFISLIPQISLWLPSVLR